MPRDPDNPRALPEQSEWTFDLIEQAHEEIRRVAQRYGLDTYPNQLEIITAEQMMDAYTSVGMPVSYNHWSFGKHFAHHEAFYRTLLRRNLRLQGVAYAIDTDGDVYLRGELPTAALDEEHLDQLLGVVLTASDDAFNELLALGFLGSMKKEWAWRVSRGESTRNLDAFRHLLEDTSPG